MRAAAAKSKPSWVSRAENCGLQAPACLFFGANGRSHPQQIACQFARAHTTSVQPLLESMTALEMAKMIKGGGSQRRILTMDYPFRHAACAVLQDMPFRIRGLSIVNFCLGRRLISC